MLIPAGPAEARTLTTEDSMTRTLAPSILSADFANLGDAIRAIDQSEAEYIHIDVMDGYFVPNISIGFPVIKAIRPYTNKIFDVHLMVQDGDRYIEMAAEAGANLITVHAEACKHLHRALTTIRKCGCKVGVALNPNTPLETIRYVMEDVDMVLIMTVDPGFGGSEYIPAMTQKIRDVRALAMQYDCDIDVEVDGGIKLSNVDTVLDAGANVIVAGSGVFKGDMNANIREFTRKIKSYGM